MSTLLAFMVIDCILNYATASFWDIATNSANLTGKLVDGAILTLLLCPGILANNSKKLLMFLFFFSHAFFVTFLTLFTLSKDGNLARMSPVFNGQFHALEAEHLFVIHVIPLASVTITRNVTKTHPPRHFSKL
ncbi:hypothetical protein RB195_012865 [Necator americanus]|uniref:Uncharacterized protein n=1 Tax=Necator americanus TaxID=51031 RepID=A0ABR1DSW1_NECAM